MEVDPLQLTLADTLRQTVEHLRNSSDDIGRMWRGIWERHKVGIAAAGPIPQTEGTRTAFPVLTMMAQLADLGITWTGEEVTPAPLMHDSIYDALTARNADRVREGKRYTHITFMTPIWKEGIHSIHQILANDGERVLTAEGMRRRYPSLEKHKTLAHTMIKLRAALDCDDRGRLPDTVEGRGPLAPIARLIRMAGWQPSNRELLELDDASLRTDKRTLY